MQEIGRGIQPLSNVIRNAVCCAEVPGSGGAVRLPWGAVRERVAFPESVYVNVNNKPGAFVLQMIFAEFTVLAEKKIELALDSQVLHSAHSSSLYRGLTWPKYCFFFTF